MANDIRFACTLMARFEAQDYDHAALRASSLVDAVRRQDAATDGDNLCSALRDASGKVARRDGAEWESVLDFYLWSGSDADAVSAAHAVAENVPGASVLQVCESPFGKLGFRPVYPEPAPFSASHRSLAAEWGFGS